MHPVGADDGIGLDLRAVGEGHLDARPSRVDAGEPLAQMHAVRWHDRGERLVQVAAVEREIGRAVARLDRASERMIVGDLAGRAVAVQRRGRAEGHLPQPILDTQTAMHPHCVRALLDAGAHARELFGLLVDLDRDAAPAQCRRDRQAADAGADNHDGTHGKPLLEPEVPDPTAFSAYLAFA
jgi:hypothetical protein